MNFLCILQVSRFVFVLKTNFYNYFYVFNHLWTGPRIPEKSGAEVFYDSVNNSSGRRVGFLVSRGFLCKNDRARGYGSILTVRL
jgi:hypothetical protein